MYKNIIIFSVLIAFVTVLAIVGLVGFKEDSSIKYFETFKFIKTPDKHNEIKAITLVNKMSSNEIKGKWHLKVYFDGDNITKFENRDTLGNVHETMNLVDSIKVNLQE
jgi:hypothetical protein